MKKFVSLMAALTLLLTMAVNATAVDVSMYDDYAVGSKWNSDCYALLRVYNANAQAVTRIERGSGYPSDVTVKLYTRIWDTDGCSHSPTTATYSFASSSAYKNATINEHTGYTDCSIASSHAIYDYENPSDEWAPSDLKYNW